MLLLYVFSLSVTFAQSETKTYGLQTSLDSLFASHQNPKMSKRGSILVMGGWRSGDTIEWYNPWNSSENRLLAARLSPPRRSHISALLDDGRVLIAGGWTTTEGKSLSLVEFLDPVKETLTSGPPMKYKRWGAAAAVVHGIVYVCGGDDGTMPWSSCERFRSGAWEKMASMSQARTDFALVAQNGTLYAIGGYDGEYYLPLVEAYDIQADRWSPKTSMPSPLDQFGGAVFGKSIFACGGCCDKKECRKYDVEEDAWTSIASMNKKRVALSLVAVGGRLVALGDDADGVGKTAEIYNPAANKWTLLTEKLLKKRSFHTALVI